MEPECPDNFSLSAVSEGAEMPHPAPFRSPTTCPKGAHSSMVPREQIQSQLDNCLMEAKFPQWETQ